MNIEEIVSIFVDSIFLKIPYEEMKRRRLGEKTKEKTDNKEESQLNEEKQDQNKIVKVSPVKKNESQKTKKKNKKIKNLDNNIFTPKKTKANNINMNTYNRTYRIFKHLTQSYCCRLCYTS